jgi:hypothetical protein
MALIFPALIYDAGAGDVTIDMTQPLEKDDHPILKLKKKDVFGGTGIRQRNVGYIEEIITITAQFEPEATVDAVDTMMKTWVLLGNTFKYVPDNTDYLTFQTVELLDGGFSPERMNTGRDFWKFKLKVRIAIV